MLLGPFARRLGTTAIINLVGQKPEPVHACLCRALCCALAERGVSSTCSTSWIYCRQLYSKSSKCETAPNASYGKQAESEHSAPNSMPQQLPRPASQGACQQTTVTPQSQSSPESWRVAQPVTNLIHPQ